jgi:hypothetical protein
VAESPLGNPYENYDLKAQAVEARDPRVRFAFEDAELLSLFQASDLEASANKRRSRLFGVLGVSLVLGALIIASGSPLLVGLSHEGRLALAYLSAALGLTGTILGCAGLRRASSRHKWLQDRLKTEVLRLFHFRYIASRLPRIASIGNDLPAQAAYVRERSAAFERRMTPILLDPEDELSRIATEVRLPDFDIGVDEEPLSGNEDDASLDRVLAAWRRLRLDWQLGYCEAKLSDQSSGGHVSSRQVEHAFAVVAWASLAVIFVLHVVLVVAAPIHRATMWLDVLVIWAALGALAARALEDGFQPHREVERYEQYRANILVARERLDLAADRATQLEVIRSFERLSLEEMRVFIRTHCKARFLL